MAKSATRGVDPTKLDYLGRGVNCREDDPQKPWLDTLDASGADKIRGTTSENVLEKPVKINRKKSNDESAESKKGAEGSVHAKPHESLKLGAELKTKRDTSKTTKYWREYQSTKIVTMLDNTSQDPDIIKRDGTHYTTYEKELSQSILDYIKIEQEKAGEAATCLGKMVNDLEGVDPVARLENYIQDTRAKKESGQQIWQIIADACCSFMNEKPYTHYVSSITLGAALEQSYESQDSRHDTSGGLKGNIADMVDGSLQGECQTVSKYTLNQVQSRGKINDDSGEVTDEEIIEASRIPVSSLINKKSQELKTIMVRLLQCYTHSDRGKSAIAYL